MNLLLQSIRLIEKCNRLLFVVKLKLYCYENYDRNDKFMACYGVINNDASSNEYS
jgi:hypothetical protein